MDGLKLLRGCNGRRTDKIRNYEVFKRIMDFDIKIKTNLKQWT